MGDQVVARLINEIYDTALSPESWSVLLTSLAEIFAGKAMVSVRHGNYSPHSVKAFAGFDVQYVESYSRSYFEQDVWQSYVSRLRAGELTTDVSMLAATDCKQSQFYDEWLHPQDLLHCIAFIVDDDGARRTQLSILRSERLGPFSIQEIELVRSIGPHIRRAVQLHRARVVTQLQRDVALQALDGLALGAMIVDSTGTLLFANAIADGVLRRGNSITVEQGRLRAFPPQQQRAIMRLIRDAVVKRAQHWRSSSSVCRLPGRDGVQPLSLLISPLCGGPVDDVLLTPAALIFISDPERAVLIGDHGLAQLYSLTAAESRLMRGILAGKKLAEYADEVGITVNTVKTYLRQILAKTGYDRQSDLVRDLLADPVSRLAAQGESVSCGQTSLARRPDMPLPIPKTLAS